MTLIQGNLIYCWFSGFKYNGGWGLRQEVLSVSSTPLVTSILGILGSDGWCPSCEFKMVWGVWPRGTMWSKGSTTLSLFCWHKWSRLFVDWCNIWIWARWSSSCVCSKEFSCLRNSIWAMMNSILFPILPDAFWNPHEEFFKVVALRGVLY